MKNNKLVALQAKRDELVKAISMKQKEIDCFDVDDYYYEGRFTDEMREKHGTVRIIGYDYYVIDVLNIIDYTSFRKFYNNYLFTLNKSDVEEYQQLEEELEELENELAEIEEQIEQLENE